MPIVGKREHGPTQVLQITFVWDNEQELKGVSGYERDATGVTFNQWKSISKGAVNGGILTNEVLDYLNERLRDLSVGR
jgi:hypothetical protein